jgi:hexulose-6-phosphate isomerase
MSERLRSIDRRRFLAAGTVSAAGAVAGVAATGTAHEGRGTAIVRPPAGRRILVSCKLSMIANEADGSPIPLVDRLRIAAQAGFDGVDLDQAGRHTAEEARDAVRESGVFVHNAINHDHWKYRLTSASDADRAQGRANIEHCIRVSHAAGGNGVLIVIGKGEDGPSNIIVERCRREIETLLPLAASLGQMILVENVWNQMFYEHDGPSDQTADRFVEFVDSFDSPWVGMYYDIGNHWKYGQPGDWIRAFGRRAVKLDVKGFSRAKDEFVDIGEGDLPWGEVRGALDEIGFTGWATAEVKGGDVDRLAKVNQQMRAALGA